MKNIFLPFYYNDAGLRLVVVQTWDQPVRYFSDKKNPFLTPYWRGAVAEGKTVSELEKKAGNVVIGESCSYEVSYVIGRVEDTHFIENSEGIRSIGIDSMNDLFSVEMPAELRLAIMQVITNELSEGSEAA